MRISWNKNILNNKNNNIFNNNNHKNFYNINNNINNNNNNKNNKPKNYFEVENCDKTTCEFPNICSDINKCQCQEGYYDINNKKTCDYKQKNYKTLLYYEMILNLGIGHILIGKKTLGIIKLIISGVAIILFIMILSMNNKVNKMKIYLNLISVIFSFASLLFYIVDFILIFIFNNYNDNNNVPLYK
jgi:hypothetical protein